MITQRGLIKPRKSRPLLLITFSLQKFPRKNRPKFAREKCEKGDKSFYFRSLVRSRARGFTASILQLSSRGSRRYFAPFYTAKLNNFLSRGFPAETWAKVKSGFLRRDGNTREMWQVKASSLAKWSFMLSKHRAREFLAFDTKHMWSYWDVKGG